MERRKELTTILLVLVVLLAGDLQLAILRVAVRYVHPGVLPGLDVIVFDVAHAIPFWFDLAAIGLFVFAMRRTEGRTRLLFGTAVAAGALGLFNTVGQDALRAFGSNTGEFHVAMKLVGLLAHLGTAVPVAWAVWALGGERARPLSTRLARAYTGLIGLDVLMRLLEVSYVAMRHEYMNERIADLLYLGTFGLMLGLVAWVFDRRQSETEGLAPAGWTGSMVVSMVFLAQSGSSVWIVLRGYANTGGYVTGEPEVMAAGVGLMSLIGLGFLVNGLEYLSNSDDHSSTRSFRASIYAALASGCLTAFASLIYISLFFWGLDRDATTLGFVASALAGAAGFVSMMTMLNGFEQMGESREHDGLVKWSGVAKWSVVGILIGSILVGFGTSVESRILMLVPALGVLVSLLVAVTAIASTLLNALRATGRADSVSR